MRNLTEKEKERLNHSLLEYIGISDDDRKKIIYKCPNHGIVHQRFDVHVKSLSCSKCSKLKEGTFTIDILNNLISKKNKNYIYEIEEKKIRHKGKNKYSLPKTRKIQTK